VDPANNATHQQQQLYPAMAASPTQPRSSINYYHRVYLSMATILANHKTSDELEATTVISHQ
jgi:hypothetical protein